MIFTSPRLKSPVDNVVVSIRVLVSFQNRVAPTDFIVQTEDFNVTKILGRVRLFSLLDLNPHLSRASWAKGQSIDLAIVL